MIIVQGRGPLHRMGVGRLAQFEEEDEAILDAATSLSGPIDAIPKPSAPPCQKGYLSGDDREVQGGVV